MNDIKNVIGILCQHLNCLFQINIKPEHFRLAKFDKCDDNVVCNFWHILYKFTVPSNLDVVDTVKTLLYSLKYQSLGFYCLPNDMSYGSRELLLALGFLITNNFIYKAMHLKIQDSPFNPRYITSSKYHRNNFAFSERSFQNIDDKINATGWIKGRINFLKKIILETDSKVKNLTKSVNNTIKIPNVEDVSLNEIFALKRQEFGKCFLLETEVALTILENHEKWIKKEKVFWEWMNTALLEKKKHSQKLNYDILEKFHLIIINNKLSDIV